MWSPPPEPYTKVNSLDAHLNKQKIRKYQKIKKKERWQAAEEAGEAGEGEETEQEDEENWTHHESCPSTSKQNFNQ